MTVTCTRDMHILEAALTICWRTVEMCMTLMAGSAIP